MPTSVTGQRRAITSDKVSMYKVYAGVDLVGFSALELGDPPMGIAFGSFSPTDGYERIKKTCSEDHANQRELNLLVMTANGVVIPALGVAIVDGSLKGIEEIEITVVGIEWSLYEQLFPRHVERYREQFK